jgi:hypothetical protein
VVELLAPFGFSVVSENDGHRGSRVEIANSCATITVSIDWLEGELDVSVQGAGGKEAVALAELVDFAEVKGLSTRRLPRGVSVGMLERRLAQIGGLLVDQSRDLLCCADDAST